jgi:glycosyltransferase involved in cell wall biosynthesis
MPVYNEAGCIAKVCREWLDEVSRRGHVLLVVDDGSTDDTPRVLKALAAETAALRVVNQSNGGHGAAVLRGYREALESGCEWVFQVDSDGQFRASDFERLWSRRLESDFILARRAGRQDPAYRRYLSGLHRILLQLVFGAVVTDPNVPYRLMRRATLRDLIAFLPDRIFAPNVFLAVLAARAGMPLLDISVTHLARSSGESTIHVRKIVRLCAHCLRELIQFRAQGFRRFRRMGRSTGVSARAATP